MKKIATLFVVFLLFLTASAQIPSAPNPPRLVNDFAGLMTEQQVATMERRLVDFNDSTDNVICVVTVKSLNGMTPNEFAYEIGDQWGVRGKRSGKNNGVVVLVKPKDETDGAVYIAVGYDLEAVLPDAFVNRVAVDSMIPFFKENDYYGGIDKAIDIMLPIIVGEISCKDYEKTKEKFLSVIAIVLTLLLIVVLPIVLAVLIFRSGGKGGKGGKGNNSGGNDLWKWILLGSVLSGGHSSGGSSGGSSSGGGYGGGYGGGGFGGFGGSGGFGGGGGGGRW